MYIISRNNFIISGIKKYSLLETTVKHFKRNTIPEKETPLNELRKQNNNKSLISNLSEHGNIEHLEVPNKSSNMSSRSILKYVNTLSMAGDLQYDKIKHVLSTIFQIDSKQKNVYNVELADKIKIMSTFLNSILQYEWTIEEDFWIGLFEHCIRVCQTNPIVHMSDMLELLTVYDNFVLIHQRRDMEKLYFVEMKLTEFVINYVMPIDSDSIDIYLKTYIKIDRIISSYHLDKTTRPKYIEEFHDKLTLIVTRVLDNNDISLDDKLIKIIKYMDITILYPLFHKFINEQIDIMDQSVFINTGVIPLLSIERYMTEKTEDLIKKEYGSDYLINYSENALDSSSENTPYIFSLFILFRRLNISSIEIMSHIDFLTCFEFSIENEEDVLNNFINPIFIQELLKINLLSILSIGLYEFDIDKFFKNIYYILNNYFDNLNNPLIMMNLHSLESSIKIEYLKEDQNSVWKKFQESCLNDFVSIFSNIQDNIGTINYLEFLSKNVNNYHVNIEYISLLKKHLSHCSRITRIKQILPFCFQLEPFENVYILFKDHFGHVGNDNNNDVYRDGIGNTIITVDFIGLRDGKVRYIDSLLSKIYD